MLAYDAELCREVIGGFIGRVFAWQRRMAKRALGLSRVRQAHCGAVTAIHRARSDLALSVHPHSLVLDGVYVQGEEGEPPVFHALPAPTEGEQMQIAWEVCQRTMRLLKKRGKYFDADPDETDALAREQPLLAACCAASLLGTVVVGERAGQQLLRLGLLPREQQEHEDATPAHGPAHGYNLHVSGQVPAHHRERLERVARYLFRPPIADSRLRVTKDHQVQYRLARPWSDGTYAVTFGPLDFLAKLLPLIPAPRTNQVIYYGVLSPAAKLRPFVVPSSPEQLAPTSLTQIELFPHTSGDVNETTKTTSTPADDGGNDRPRLRYRWAQLIRRIYRADVETCPSCGHGPMRLVAVITDTAVLSRLLDSHDPSNTTEPGWHTPAAGPRGPPQLSLPFGTTNAAPQAA